MKQIKLAAMLFVLSGLVMLNACSSDDDDDDTLGNWTKVTPFKGVKRSGAFSFTIGTKVFVGLGYDGDDYWSDVYGFDINNGYWESMAPFPGKARERAVAFSVNGKGYVGLGYNRDEDTEELRDFWEYDPATNAWDSLGLFGGSARYNAIAFAIGSKGYVGTGYDGDNTNSDFWQYDPSTNTWSEIVSYPGDKIESGLAFVVDGKAYIGTGRDNGLFNLDFWEFVPGTDGSNPTWTKRTPDDDESDYDEFKLAMYRYDATAVTVGTKVYIIGGVASTGAAVKTVYVFDATTFDWDDRTGYEGSARSLAVGYVLSDRIFVGTGQNGTSRYDDIWEFKPLEEYDETY
ncbi:Kelch repeat-containing protein [Ohtaekwangia koreensis]|uniref:Galactose oxidase, central domain n=1 Tax=Ohtaekwangia koreensis TaxID=688867 RepID=A0A1T5L651_9BACT|nr:kelch repeat-containing protein [Ohtaekwangia koreensis]SKC71527.1 Galactose oxidase, central domain [Ohtaekwangia koreensis]